MPTYIVRDTHIKHGAKGAKTATTYAPGEQIELSEKEAAALGASVVPAAEDGIIARTKPIEKMTVPELKDLLDRLEVAYPSDAKKEDLLELVKTHTAEPPGA